MIIKNNSKPILIIFSPEWGLKGVLNRSQTTITFANSLFFVKITINMCIMGLKQVHHS